MDETTYRARLAVIRAEHPEAYDLIIEMLGEPPSPPADTPVETVKGHLDQLRNTVSETQKAIDKRGLEVVRLYMTFARLGGLLR